MHSGERPFLSKRTNHIVKLHGMIIFVEDDCDLSRDMAPTVSDRASNSLPTSRSLSPAVSDAKKLNKPIAKSILLHLESKTC